MATYGGQFTLTNLVRKEQVLQTALALRLRMKGLEPKNTAEQNPENNGIAEGFEKTIKHDHISIIPKPDGLTAAKNLTEASELYNEWHPA